MCVIGRITVFIYFNVLLLLLLLLLLLWSNIMLVLCTIIVFIDLAKTLRKSTAFVKGPLGNSF